ncbi:uncharacterized protein LOC106066064 isoform X2 [Biomphalaria glabrata]|uniref:Uncharacterized protein LOC106066064 isoform X2 n=1 Tax=Biomphalaria glabrata TaxID=6526 RepID=A0A9W3AGE7_BIOGL|nr:uncharacterized protein LOC106066064 isoform X2 [Biomphalaria glabrata]
MMSLVYTQFSISLLLFGLLCSKSTCKLGRICMDKKPIVFAGSVLEVCCTINASFTGELVEFEYLKTKAKVRTEFGTRKVCYNFTLFAPDSLGSFSSCRIEHQRQCKDFFLIVVEKPFPRTFNADCYTQFPNLVCQWEMPTFIVKRRNVTVTMNVEVLNSNARQLNTIHCGNATACILNLSDLSVWANGFPVNVSLTLTYKDVMLELSSISTPWYWIHPYTWHKEKLQLEKFSVTNITSTCLTIHWSTNVPDISIGESAITSITLETDGETHYANKVNGDVNDDKDVTRPGNQTICNLTPFTAYNVSLMSRFPESTVWSDTIQNTFVTLPDVPKCGPEVSPGGYNIVKNDQSYQAVVYWKIPSNRDWRSDTQLGYYIYQNHSNEGKVLIQELGQSISFFRTDVVKHGTTSLYIKSKNNIGKANCSAHVFKFQENHLQKDISSVQAFWKNGVVEVTWTTRSSFNIMATVYWCKFSNETDICNSPIQWLEVGNVHLKHPSIQLSLTEAQTFQYGVSVFNNITNTSAGITWTMCLKAFQDGKEILSRNCDINLNKVDSLVTVIVTVILFSAVVLLGPLVYFICKCHKRQQEIKGLYNNSSEHEPMIDTNNSGSVTNNCQNSSESSCNQSSESAQSEGIVSTASSYVDVSSQCSEAEVHLTSEWTNDVLRSTTDSGQTKNIRELNEGQILNGRSPTRPKYYVRVCESTSNSGQTENVRELNEGQALNEPNYYVSVCVSTTDSGQTENVRELNEGQILNEPGPTRPNYYVSVCVSTTDSSQAENVREFNEGQILNEPGPTRPNYYVSVCVSTTDSSQAENVREFNEGQILNEPSPTRPKYYVRVYESTTDSGQTENVRELNEGQILNEPGPTRPNYYVSVCVSTNDSGQTENVREFYEGQILNEPSPTRPKYYVRVYESTTDSGQTENVRELNEGQILNEPGPTRPNYYVSVCESITNSGQTENVREFNEGQILNELGPTRPKYYVRVCESTSNSGQTENVRELNEGQALNEPNYYVSVCVSTTDSGQTENVRELNEVQILNEPGPTRPNYYVSVCVSTTDSGQTENVRELNEGQILNEPSPTRPKYYVSVCESTTNSGQTENVRELNEVQIWSEPNPKRPNYYVSVCVSTTASGQTENVRELNEVQIWSEPNPKRPNYYVSVCVNP